MVRRVLGALTLGAAALIACSSLRYPPPVAASVGDVAPQWLATEPDRVTIVWAFRAEDILKCGNAAMAIRHTIARLGPRVDLIALPIGDDAGLVESFMRRERLRPSVTPISERRFARAFGASPVPAMYIVSDGRIRMAAMSDSLWSDGTLKRDRPLEATVSMFLD